MKSKNICVYGAASDRIHPDYLAGAEALGRAIRDAGLGLVFGAGNTGVMGACARGAQGGRVIGVAPRFFDQPGVLYPDCSWMIFTDTMRQRKRIMERLSAGFVMAPGGIGTMEEFFEILTLRSLGRHRKPVVILNLRDYFHDVEIVLRRAVAEGFASPELETLYAVADTPQEAVRRLLEAMV